MIFQGGSDLDDFVQAQVRFRAPDVNDRGRGRGKGLGKRTRPRHTSAAPPPASALSAQTASALVTTATHASTRTRDVIELVSKLSFKSTNYFESIGIVDGIWSN